MLIYQCFINDQEIQSYPTNLFNKRYDINHDGKVSCQELEDDIISSYRTSPLPDEITLVVGENALSPSDRPQQFIVDPNKVVQLRKMLLLS